MATLCNCSAVHEQVPSRNYGDFDPVLPNPDWLGFAVAGASFVAGFGSTTQIHALVKHPAHVAAVSAYTWGASLCCNIAWFIFGLALGSLALTASSAANIVADLIIVLLIVKHHIAIQLNGGAYNNIVTMPKIFPVMPLNDPTSPG